MYGGRTKPQKYCTIPVYLQHNAPGLFENIQDLCLYKLFSLRKGKGVTFLLPDSKGLKQINDATKNNSSLAVELIQACVIPKYLSSISDFSTYRDSIVNKNKQKIDIKSVNTTTVRLANGAELTKDSAYKRLYPESSNSSVFKLKGPIATGGTKVTGGYTIGGNDTEFNKDGRKGLKMFSWKALFDQSSSSGIKNRSKFGLIDPWSHGIISLNYFLKNSSDAKLNSIYTISVCTSTVSPLHFLSVAPLLGAEGLKKWVQTPGDYDKLEQYKDQLDQDIPESYYSSLDNAKYELVHSIDKTNICEKIKELFRKQCGSLKAESKSLGLRVDLGTAIQNVFKSDEKFCKWWLASCELSNLFTESYISAYSKLDSKTPELKRDAEGDIKKICDLYSNHYLNNLVDKKYGACAFILDETTLNADSNVKERFCAALAFLVNDDCMASGSNNSIEYARKSKKRSPCELKPNNLKATSYSPGRNNFMISKIR